jgi:hypothetical protein
MLDKSTLKNLIQYPEKITKEIAQELQEITKKYPFFAWGHTLLTHFAQQNEQKLYADSLKKASIHSFSRNALRNFLKNKSSEIAQNLKVEDIIGEKKNTQVEEEKSFFDSFLTENEQQEIQTPKEDDFFVHISPQEETPIYEYALINEGKAIGLHYEGKNTEAIFMYRKLAQIYPDKKAYYKEQLLEMLGNDRYKFKEEIKVFENPLTQKEENQMLGIKEEIIEDETKEEKTNILTEKIETSTEEKTNILTEKIETSTEEKTNIVTEKIETSTEEKTNIVTEKIETLTEEKTNILTEKIETLTEEKTEILTEKIISKSEQNIPEDIYDVEKYFHTLEEQAINAFVNKNYKEALRLYEDLEIQNEKRADYYVKQMDAIVLTPSLERSFIKNIYFDHTRSNEWTEELAIKLYTHERSAEAIFIYEKLIDTNPKKEKYYRAQMAVITQ